MKTKVPGHVYSLENNKTGGTTDIKFYCDPEINPGIFEEMGTIDGPTNQEYLRAIIERVKFLDEQEPADENKEIIKHARAMIILHEQRHLRRILEKGLEVENIKVLDSGHFV